MGSCRAASLAWIGGMASVTGTIPSSTVGSPDKSELSQNSCCHLLPYKMLNIEIILYLLLQLIARLNDDD